MAEHTFFFVGLAFILAHEMDAVKRHEWRIFPLLSRLDDARGYLVYTALHVPLYLLLFLFLFAEEGPNLALVRALDLFFMVHVALHLLFLRHPRNEFRAPFSWLLILGAGAFGAFDLPIGA